MRSGMCIPIEYDHDPDRFYLQYLDANGYGQLLYHLEDNEDAGKSGMIR